ncbi:MAG: damage-inducible protein [Paludibacter sp.]|nr:damage-inducible protein [Paludibacter sp.]
MSDIEIYDSEGLSFEDFKNQNGITFWWASEVLLMLGYQDLKSFKPTISRATRALISLGIDHYENIMHTVRDDGREDFKLTRFACYIVAMNADPKKKEVAQVQAYFAQQTRNFELVTQGSGGIDRILIREEITEGYKSLTAAAKKSGVVDFAKFQNEGYRGMYNMMNVQLAHRRGVDKGHLFDTMGRTELAANLFRMTQTEEGIKSQKVKSAELAERTHYDVGREVRNMVIKNTGKNPESLPQEREIPHIKRELKQGLKELKKLDNPKNKK